MAAWTQATLLAREGDEHLVAAVGTGAAGEAEVQVAAAKESAGRLTEIGRQGLARTTIEQPRKGESR